MQRRVLGALMVTLAAVAGACSDDDSDTASSASPPATPATTEPAAPTTPAPTTPPTTESLPPTTPAPETTAAEATAPSETAPATTTPPTDPEDTSSNARQLVEALAADELTGRDNNTPGSLAAQDVIIEQLAQFAQPIDPAQAGDPNGFRHEFPAGTNVIGVIPGGDLADEWVVIGAHYDALGSDCRGAGPADAICNGATDNATGVAAAIGVARAIAEAGTARRSVLIGLWDAEEDGLLGSAAYLQAPNAPPAQMVAYLNFDNMGSNLLPGTADATVLVGAESGGPALVEAARTAGATTSLQPLHLSLVFGQGRSDHASFAAAGVPTVFFTDATGPCYHTPADDVAVVDFDKLDEEIAIATALATDLVATDTPPVFDPTAPLTTFADAETMLDAVTRASPYFSRFSPEGQAASEQYLTDLEAIVAAGPGAFDDADVGPLLGGAVAFVDALTTGECDGFLD